MDACANNDLARSIAPLFAGKHSHELTCIIEYVFTEQDQALRFAVSKALSYKDAHRLNMLWHMLFNPEIIEQPYEDDYKFVYRAIGLLRQAVRENNMRVQLQLIERLGFYFENRTIDYIAPLMQVALTKEDHFFVELMSLYLRPYEKLNMLVVWDYLFNWVKTPYNIADEIEEAELKRKLEAAKAAQEEKEKEEELCPVEKALFEFEPENYQLGDDVAQEKEIIVEEIKHELADAKERAAEASPTDSVVSAEVGQDILELEKIGQAPVPEEQKAVVEPERAAQEIAEEAALAAEPSAPEKATEEPVEQMAQIGDQVAQQPPVAATPATENAIAQEPRAPEQVTEEPVESLAAIGDKGLGQ